MLPTPREGRACLVDAAGDDEAHGGLHVVPRVEVTAREPRNRTVGALRGHHGVGRGLQLGGVEDPGEGEGGVRHECASRGFV